MKSVKVTSIDRHRLKNSIFDLIAWVEPQHLDYIEELDRKLDEADIIMDPRHAPRDLITMRSRVRVRGSASNLESGVYTLVYPFETDPYIKNVSVISALGAALLGMHKGDQVTLPDGSGAVEIDAVVYQPEAEGHHHL